MRWLLSHARRFGAVLLVVSSSHALAQEALPIPTFRELSFEEDWSGLGAHESRIAGDPWLSWKFAPLSHDRRTWISLGGSLRLRGEGRTQAGLGTTPTGIVNETAFLGRALVHADLHVLDGFRVFVEGRSALVTGRDSEITDRPTDADHFDFQNAFVESTAQITRSVVGVLRAGRLELALGSQRLVSPVDWRNSRTNFDGGEVLIGAPGFLSTFFLTSAVDKSVNSIDSTDTGSLFYGAHAEWFDESVAFEVYHFGLRRDDWSIAGESGDENRGTVGLGATIPFFYGSRATAEGAYQFGKVGAAKIRSYMYALGVSRPVWRGTTLRLGATYASGDNESGDGRVGTFDQLFGDTHRYYGLVDAVGGQNLVDFEVGLDAQLFDDLSVSLAFHRLARANKSDALYGPLGNAALPANSTSRFIGDEVDLSARYTLRPFWTLDAGVGYLLANDFLADTSTGDNTVFAYASVTLTL